LIEIRDPIADLVFGHAEQSFANRTTLVRHNRCYGLLITVCSEDGWKMQKAGEGLWEIHRLGRSVNQHRVRAGTFGPVAAITVADDVEHAIELANANDYGFGGKLWTANTARVQRISHGAWKPVACSSTALARQRAYPVSGDREICRLQILAKSSAGLAG
jgi:hypothetical protein